MSKRTAYGRANREWKPYPRLVMAVVVRMMVMVPRPCAVAVRDGLRGGEDEAAGFDALRADQIISQRANLKGRPAQENHFEAPLFVKVHVRRCHNAIKMVMLQIGQPSRNS